MLTITLEKEKLSKTNFTDFKELFDYVDNNTLLKQKNRKTNFRDEYWFTKDSWKELIQIRENSKKWKNISKVYSNLWSLLSDLKNDAINYN